MFEFLQGLIDQSIALVRAAIVLIALATVAVTAWRTRMQLIPVIVMLLVAGLAIWGVNNIEWFERKIGDETLNTSAPPLVDTAADLRL